MAEFRMKRGTRAQINSAAASSGLAAGEPYLITDEARIAVGLSATTYQAAAKQGEGGGSAPAWHGVVYGAAGGCDPAALWLAATHYGTAAATPTNITISIARCAYFRPPADITVEKIRFYGTGSTTSVYRLAIYNADTLARVTAALPITTVINTWGSVNAGPVTLTSGQLYFIACSVNTTGTTAGLLCQNTSQAPTTGMIAVAPKNWPGSLDIDAGFLQYALAQFAVTTGALPATAPTVAGQSQWSGGMPAFWLDSNSA